jgi:hypothetical protein
MTVSAVTLTPGAAAPGVGASAEATAVARAADPRFADWMRRASAAGGCTRPVRLQPVGQGPPGLRRRPGPRLPIVDTATGEVLPPAAAVGDGPAGPDAEVYTACGNRRASVCSACAEIYRGDAYRLVLAGLRGGLGVPDSVARHPAVFVTLTAPSFGLVHSQRPHERTGRPRRCRPRRHPQPCPHGMDLRCPATHQDGDPELGLPLCPDCYDYDRHAVWNAWASELWRRTTITLHRIVHQVGRVHGGPLRLSYGKVAEYQRRGVVHFHALIRLDGLDPTDPERVVPPPAWANVFLLAYAIRQAVERVCYTTPAHPARPAGWRLAWGDPDKGLHIRPVRIGSREEITDTKVSGYIAKYATKGTEVTGHTSTRLTSTTITHYATATHPGRLVAACWRIGGGSAGPEYWRLRRWAHMLGHGGHFFTKSRRYTATFRHLRTQRVLWQRRHDDLADQHDQDTATVVVAWSYAGIGWRSTGDALLARTAAALARERRRIGREETVCA